MTDLTNWLLSAMQPLVVRVMSALGLSVVTVTGVTTGLGQVKQLLIDRLYALPADYLGVFLLIGGGDALGLIFGAWAFSLLMKAVGNVARFFSLNAG